jgi:hypothetical protein
VRPQACASIFPTPSCFANVYARVPLRTIDWPLIVTESVPEMTAYADAPSTFAKSGACRTVWPLELVLERYNLCPRPSPRVVCLHE